MTTISKHEVYEKDGVRVVHEYFPSIYHLLETLDSRPNNKVMESERSSITGSKDFTGTSSYEEAKELLASGYTDILSQLTLGIKKATKAIKDIETAKSYLIEDVIGCVPIIPNYLQGLPKTMSYRKPVPKKTKTIHIIYSPAENCCTSTEEFIKAGVAILSAIRVIEKGNVSIQLDSLFTESYSESSKEYCFGLVKIKDYKDRLDLQKLCFPIAHPSMLRRIGFKFLETVPELKSTGFRGGYGRSMDADHMEEHMKLPKDAVLLNLRLVGNQLGNDPKKVIEYINKKLAEKK